MKIPILMYHEVYRPEDRGHLEGLTNPAYNTELATFKKQMTWLSENHFKTLTIDELISEDSIKNGQAICLTFDDGWMGNYQNVYPILQEKGFKATFFIATELIGKRFYMTWDHLKEIMVNGMSVQSHTVTHRPLGGLQEKEIIFELSESKKAIEERLGTRINHISLPHGSKNVGIWPLAKKLGYKSICTSDVGFQNWESNGPWIKRINIGDGISGKQFQSIVRGKSQAILKMKINKYFKNKIKSLIGANMYRKLYRWVYDLK